MTRALVVSAMLLAALPAHADEQLEIAKLLDANHGGTAYVRAGAAVAIDPDNATLRYLYALAALRTVHRDVCDAQIAAGLALPGDHPDLLGLRSYLEVTRGQLDEAGTDAERAEALSPDESWAKDVLAAVGIHMQAEERLTMAMSPYPTGSPEREVDHLIERTFAGAMPLELASYFDVSLLDALPADKRTHDELVALIAFVERDVQNTSTGKHVRGWVVERARLSGATSTVLARISVESVFTRDHIELLKEMLASPTRAELISRDIMETLAQVDPAEQGALLDRLVGQTGRDLVNVEFQLVHDGDDYRVSDVRMNGIDYAAQVPALYQLAGSRSSRITARVGYLMIVIGAAGTVGIIGGFVINALRGPGRARRRR